MSHTRKKKIMWGVGACVALATLVFSLPSLLALKVDYERQQAFKVMRQEFPITVNPLEKVIIEDPLVDAYLESAHSPLQAAVGNMWDTAESLFASLAATIANAPWYHGLAAADGRIVNITAGMRKEQVVNAFGSVLGWNAAERKQFVTASPYSSLPLTEGSFAPGIYLMQKDTSPMVAQALVNQRFSESVLSRYGTTTSRLVPLEQALTIASLIEREAGGPDDMRLISGIIWNRLFIDMPLQIDATLQYVKANASSVGSWWPKPVPADRFRKSPYNTYLHKGLPPSPIANPSVAAVLAALNPKKTSCFFYFHDSLGGFHCTNTYEEHVALLKKYYGRGK